MTKATVFIGVLKTPEDLSLLLRDRWYRIPADSAPGRAFRYMAFYQPASFGKDSGKIRYYAAVRSRFCARRLELLPDDPLHPAAEKLYIRYELGPPRELERPVQNSGRERLTFAYTTLRRLKSARDLHGLFGVPPLEKILHADLKRAGLGFAPEHMVLENNRCRYRLDFAVFCGGGKLDIECDGRRWHALAAVKKRDALRDAWLAGRGWTILRLSENDILRHRVRAMARIREAARALGGAGRAQ